MMPRHILVLPIINLGHVIAHFGPDTKDRPKMCITGTKVCNGQLQNMSGQLDTYVGSANGQSGKNLYCLQ
jgi:hypothetical protein